MDRRHRHNLWLAKVPKRLSPPRPDPQSRGSPSGSLPHERKRDLILADDDIDAPPGRRPVNSVEASVSEHPRHPLTHEGLAIDTFHSPLRNRPIAGDVVRRHHLARVGVGVDSFGFEKSDYRNQTASSQRRGSRVVGLQCTSRRETHGQTRPRLGDPVVCGPCTRDRTYWDDIACDRLSATIGAAGCYPCSRWSPHPFPSAFLSCGRAAPRRRRCRLDRAPPPSFHPDPARLSGSGQRKTRLPSVGSRSVGALIPSSERPALLARSVGLTDCRQPSHGGGGEPGAA